MPDPYDDQSLNRETQAIWNENAAYWDQRMGEGNLFQRMLVGPATERLLAVKPGERVLDVACGNGVFARRLAALGARVVACDFAADLIARAQARTTENVQAIDYRIVDATREDELLALGKQQFDAAVCNMALMDMVKIEPLVSALTQLLRPHGRFVFSVLHPCFNSTGTRLAAEEEDREGRLVPVFSIRVVEYTDLGPAKGEAMPGQPVPQYYFHRTISKLFNTCFQAGFVLDGMEEPTFSQVEQPASNRPLNWANYTRIPPVMAARMRMGKAPTAG